MKSLAFSQVVMTSIWGKLHSWISSLFSPQCLSSLSAKSTKWMLLPPSRTVSPKTHRTRIPFIFLHQLFCSKTLLTLKSCSMRCKALQFSSSCKSHCTRARSSVLSRYHKFAFYQIICISHILHSSSTSKCCECTFGKVLLLDFKRRKMCLVHRQMA